MTEFGRSFQEVVVNSNYLEAIESPDPIHTNQDLIAGSLVFGRTDHVAELFSQNRRRTPLILWSPDDGELQSGEERDFFATCTEMTKGQPCIPDSSLDISQLSEFSDWLMLIDVVGGGTDYRYTYYGAGIAEHFGKDMRGRLCSEFTGFISTFFMALYRAAMIRKERVYSIHEPPRSVFVRVWHRVIVPITDACGDVVRFVVLNLPESELRSGLAANPAPSFAVTDRGLVLYANTPALDLLGKTSTEVLRKPVTQVFNLSLDFGISADELLHEKMTLHQQLVWGERVHDVSISAARHAGEPIYLIFFR